MRIIRGKYRSRKIRPPHNFKARPTTDFAKEGLFNILENKFSFEGLRVLDLFSGTGCISYEFLSRGCAWGTAVEMNKKNAFFIEKTGGELFPENFNIIKANAFTIIQKMNLDYDIIFADPPYDISGIENIPAFIFANETLKKNSLLIVEHSEKTDLKELQFFKEKRSYGKVNFSFFENN